MIAAIFRAECTRKGSKGKDLLRRLFQAIVDCCDTLQKEPAEHLLVAKTFSMHLHNLLYLAVLLVTESAEDCVRIASACGLCGSLLATIHTACEALRVHPDVAKIGLRSAIVAVPPWIATGFLCMDGLQRIALVEEQNRKVLTCSNQLLGVESGIRWEYLPPTRPYHFDLMDRGWARLHPAPAAVLEREFSRGARTAQTIVDGFSCVVDLVGMTLVNSANKERFNVRRSVADARAAPPVAASAASHLSTDISLTAMQLDDCCRAVGLCADLLTFHLDQNTLNAVFRVAVRLTRNASVAAVFAEKRGLESLLVLPSSSCFQGSSTLYSVRVN